MSVYKLSTGLWTTKLYDFNSDKDAWEELRTHLPNKFATLYKEVEVAVTNNNEEEYVPTYNSKYGPKPIGYGGEDAELKEIGTPSTHSIWMPVLEGITSHGYKV